jgi:hypothetical protein
MKFFKFIVLLVILFYNVCLAQFDYGFEFSKSGTAGFQFLKIGIGAHQTALGEAVSGLVNDAQSVFWNPAGLGWMQKKQVTASYTKWLIDSQHSAIAIAIPFHSVVFAFDLVSLNIKQFEETTVENPTGTGRMVDAGNLLFGFAVAKRFTDRLTIGGQIKYVEEKLDDVSFGNILFDVGTIYFTGFRDLRLSFTFQHFGPDKKVFDQKFKMPLLFRVGVGDNIIENNNFRLTTAIDLVHPTDNNEWVNWGVEMMLLDAFALRGGYRFNVDEGKLTIGFGLAAPGLEKVQPKVDYAYVSFGDILGATHRFSLGFSF